MSFGTLVSGTAVTDSQATFVINILCPECPDQVAVGPAQPIILFGWLVPTLPPTHTNITS